MKRFLNTFLLCTVSIICLGQEWNTLGTHIKRSTNVYDNITYVTLNCKHLVTTYTTDSIRLFIYTDQDGWTHMLTYDSFDNSYNYVNTKYKGSSIVNENVKLYSIPETYSSLVTRTVYKQNKDTVTNFYDIVIPKPIYNRYLFGKQLMTAGWINFGVGIGLTAIGGVLYGTGLNSKNTNHINSGIAILSTGSALISVSIPLLCFGDNAKRESNTDFEMFELFYKSEK